MTNPLTGWRRFRAGAAYAVLRSVRRMARRFPWLRMDRIVRLAGAIDGHSWAPRVKVKDPTFGRSMTIAIVERFEVDGTTGTAKPSVLAPVASTVFAGVAPFTFNVAFACGKSKKFKPSTYGNPRSHWFNVFLGYYEIDVPARRWGRPFGYASADPINPRRICCDDLDRITCADWNYFSNRVYGVPLDVLDSPGRPGTWSARSTAVIGSREWDVMKVIGSEVRSTYVASAGRQLERPAGFLTDLWRAAFGQPYVCNGPYDRVEPSASFVPTKLSGELRMCFDGPTEDGMYRTFIFGGSVNNTWEGGLGDRVAFNQQFLAVQLSTLDEVILTSFPCLGFRTSVPAPPNES